MPLQQVNLYLPELRPTREWITANTLAFASCGVVVMFAMIYFMLQMNLNSLQEQVIELETRGVLAQESVEKIKNKAKPVRAEKLDQELILLKQAIRSRKRVERFIEGENFGNEVGFAKAMEAMARESMPSLSLQHIYIAEGGGVLKLRGETLKLEDVAIYIQRLQQNYEFNKTNFGALNIEEQENRGRHAFSLGFKGDPERLARGGKP